MTVLDAQTICSLARATAKCPNYKVQSGQLLNAILEELAQSYDFDTIKAAFSFSFNSGGVFGQGPYPLPANYYRGIDKDIFYTIDGVPYPMIKLETEQMDNLVTTAGLNGYPLYYSTNMEDVPPTMTVWPPSSGSYPVTVKYFKASPTIATPETSSSSPWFPLTTYLVRRLTGELCLLTDDDRAAVILGNKDEDKDTAGSATDLLRQYLKMKDDTGGLVKQVQLDRRYFGVTWDRLPNTKRIGW